jgi:integrase
MRGCRPFTDDEVQELLNSFKNSDALYAKRDRAWLALGINCGFRITELLSLKIRDVSYHWKAIPYATARRNTTKGKKEGRTLPVEPWAQHILQEWLDELREQEEVETNWYVFLSHVGTNRSITRQWAYNILIEECSKNSIYGNIGTHSMRKTFANKMRIHYLNKFREGEKIDPQEILMQATGHKHEESLKAYLSFLHLDKDSTVFNYQS